MWAVHFLRSRQEESELSYWLALVAYNRQDRSINNRIYLVYLVLFFSIWIFITLTFFASGGAAFLQIINTTDPVRSAVFLLALMLSIWNLVRLFQAVRRSPIEFSEQDAVLLCQMPIDRRYVTLRWLVMPWLKSAVPFWLVAVILGFSCAELILPGETFADRIIGYSGYGLRAWLAVIPVHLWLFTFQWIAGIIRLQRDKERRWYGLIVFMAVLALTLLCLILISTQGAASSSAIPLLQTGLGEGSLRSWLLGNWLAAAGMQAVLYSLSGNFHLGRAAQETQEVVARNTAIQYGFTGLAQNMQRRKRLGAGRAPTRLRSLPGPGSLIWKDAVQSLRSIQLQSLFDWLILFSLMFSLPFLPDITSRAFAFAFWVVQVSKLSVVRLRSDLSNWSLVRQLPIAHKKFLLFELTLPYLLSVLLSFGGMFAYAVFFGDSLTIMAALIPGLAAGAVGVAALSVLRGARTSLLINSAVPEAGAGSVLIGIILALIPFLIAGNIPGLPGLALSVLISLLYGGAALLTATRAYQSIAA